MTKLLARSHVRFDAIELALPARLLPRVTHDEFARLCASNRGLRLELSARVELIVMPPAGSDSGRRNADLTTQLGARSRWDGSRFAFDSSADFTLPDCAIRSPDARWIRKDRWSALSQKDRGGFEPICPNFVVAVRSSSNTLVEIEEKMVEYLDQGARLGRQDVGV